MRLRDLDPRLMRYSGEATFQTVECVGEADCVMFLCPHCFAANGGPRGTHRIRIDFLGRGTPDEHCIRNSSGTPVRWGHSGGSIDDLSLSPSIQILGGCNWHGFVQGGGIINA